MLLSTMEDNQEAKISKAIGKFFKVFINELRCKTFFTHGISHCKNCNLIHNSSEPSVLAKEIRKMLLNKGNLDNCDNLSKILNSHNAGTRKLSQLLLDIFNEFQNS